MELDPESRGRDWRELHSSLPPLPQEEELLLRGLVVSGSKRRRQNQSSATWREARVGGTAKGPQRKKA